MDYFIAVVLGIVEGITEFLPISSTGHMILVGHLLNADSEQWHVFEVFVQLGAIFGGGRSLLAAFSRLTEFPGQATATKRIFFSFQGFSGLWKIFLGCVPAFILGALADEQP